MPDGDNATLPSGCPPSPPTRPATEAPTLVPTSPPPDTLVPLPVVPGYDIEGTLGRGGMGVVFRARQLSLNRVVALKMIPTGALSAPEDMARFLAEAEAVAAVRHPNIVEIFDSGNHQGTPYFAMELCPNGSLAERLLPGPLPPGQAAEIVMALAGAVQAAHDKNIIHRDLKPANVLLAADGAPKITDFGLAKRLEVDRHLTHTGSVMGTPSYMAPEQARGKKDMGPGVDIWSLGAVLYECLTGRPPFKGATPIETLYQVTELDAVAVRALRPDVPRDLETITLKCLQKDPERRYETAAALAEDLSRFRDGKPILARPVGAWEQAWKWARRNPAPAAWGSFALVTLVAAAVVSTLFGLEARHQASQAAKREGEAREALADREQALAQLERERAAGLLRPLGTDKQKVELNDVELNALKELASLPRDRDRVRVLFLELALDTPQTRGQLSHRLELAVHAAVGLSPELRREVVGRLRGKAANSADPDVKELCDRIEELLETPQAKARRAADKVKLEKVKDDPKEEARAERAAAARLPAGEVAELLARARKAGVRPGDADGRARLKLACAALAGRKDLADAAAVTVDLALRWFDAAENATEEEDGPDLGRALAHLAGPMRDPLPPRLAAVLFDRVWRFRAAERQLYFSDDEDLLAVLGGRLDEGEATKLAAALVTRAARSRTPHQLLVRARAYAALADKLPPARARRDAPVLARTIQDVPTYGNPNTQALLAEALAALADHLDADDCRGLTRALLAGLKLDRAADVPARARALRALAPHLPTGEAHPALREVAHALLSLVPTMDALSDSQSVHEAFAGAVSRLPAADLPPLARSLGEMVPKVTDAEALWSLAMMFAAIEARLGDGPHRQVADVLAPAYFGAVVRRRPAEKESHQARDAASHAAAVRGMVRTLSVARRVELLKHPACVEWEEGKPMLGARHLVLASLAGERGRPFAGLWDLVEWLEKEQPQLDPRHPPVLPLDVPPAPNEP